MGSSGHFSTINGIVYALPNLEQAFAHIFKHNSSGKPNVLLTNALSQWKAMLADQCEATSIKNLPVDFIESKIMETICNFAQALLDPSLDRIHDPDIINARVVAATAVDARAMRADGDRVRLNRLDNKGHAKSMSLTLPAGGGGKRKLDAIGSIASNQPWRQSSTSNSSATSTGFHVGANHSAVPPSQGRQSLPCLHHITHQLFKNDASGKFTPCKLGQACKFDHYQIPTDQNGSYQFESSDRKNFVLNSTRNIKDPAIRLSTKQAIEAIPAKP